MAARYRFAVVEELVTPMKVDVLVPQLTLTFRAAMDGVVGVTCFDASAFRLTFSRTCRKESSQTISVGNVTGTSSGIGGSSGRSTKVNFLYGRDSSAPNITIEMSETAATSSTVIILSKLNFSVTPVLYNRVLKFLSRDTEGEETQKPQPNSRLASGESETVPAPEGQYKPSALQLVVSEPYLVFQADPTLGDAAEEVDMRCIVMTADIQFKSSSRREDPANDNTEKQLLSLSLHRFHVTVRDDFNIFVDEPLDSSFSLVEPFDMHLESDKSKQGGRRGIAGTRVIGAKIDKVSVSLSYVDFHLALLVLDSWEKSVSKLSNAAMWSCDFCQHTNLAQSSDCEVCGQVRPSEDVDSGSDLLQGAIFCGPLDIVITDDCSGFPIPMIRIQARETEWQLATTDLNKREMGAGSSSDSIPILSSDLACHDIVFQAETFNSKLGLWEPIVEPVRMDTTISSCLGASTIQLGCQSVLNLTVSHQAIREIFSRTSGWIESVGDRDDYRIQRHLGRPLAIENKTTCPIEVSIGSSDWTTIIPGCSSHMKETKASSGNTSLVLRIQIEGRGSTTLDLQRKEQKFHRILHGQSGARMDLFGEVFIVNGFLHVEFQPVLSIKNITKHSLELLLWSSNADEAWAQAKPGEIYRSSSTLPEGTCVSIRPQMISDGGGNPFRWAQACELEGSLGMKKRQVIVIPESRASRPLYFHVVDKCILVKSKDCKLIPRHEIVISPPIMVENSLPVPIEFYIKCREGATRDGCKYPIQDPEYWERLAMLEEQLAAGAPSKRFPFHVYENQRRKMTGEWSSHHLMPMERPKWSHGDGVGNYEEDEQGFPRVDVPLGWRWSSGWYITHDFGDSDGWQYSFNWPHDWSNSPGFKTFVRRRKWHRDMESVDDIDVAGGVLPPGHKSPLHNYNESDTSAQIRFKIQSFRISDWIPLKKSAFKRPDNHSRPFSNLGVKAEQAGKPINLRLLDTDESGDTHVDCGRVLSVTAASWIINETPRNINIGYEVNGHVGLYPHQVETVVEVCYENERLGNSGWVAPFLPGDPAPLTDVYGFPISSAGSYPNIPLKDQWAWAGEWQVEGTSNPMSDAEGWRYGVDWQNTRHQTRQGADRVRRRRLCRVREPMLQESDRRAVLCSSDLIAISVDGCPFSEVFDISTPGNSGQIDVEVGKGIMPLSVSVEKESGSLMETNVVRIRSAVLLENSFDVPILLKQASPGSKQSMESVLLQPKERVDFAWPNRKESLLLRMSLLGETGPWTNEFSIQLVGRVCVLIPAHDVAMIVDVRLCDSGKLVSLGPDNVDAPAYCIHNNTKFDVVVKQKTSQRNFSVSPMLCVPFAWDYPSRATEIEVYIANEKHPIRCNFDETNVHKVVNIAPGDKLQAVHIWISLVGSGSNKLYIFTQDSMREPVKAPQDMKVQCTFPELGISLVDSRPSEVVYCSMTNCKLMSVRGGSLAKYSVTIGDIQIDNQMLGTYNPIALSTKKAKNRQQDVFQLFVSQEHRLGADYYDLVSLSFSKHLVVTLDSDFIKGLHEVLVGGMELAGKDKLVVTGQVLDVDRVLDRKAGDGGSIFSIHNAKPKAPPPRPVHIDRLIIEEVKITVTFQLLPGPVDLGFSFLQLLGSTKLKLDRVMITLDSLNIRHASGRTLSDLQAVILEHYSTQVKRQAVKVIGSVNLLGNPSSLFTNIGVGVSDFVSNPMNAKTPEQFIQGSAKGTKSLVKHTLAGVATSAGAVTDTIGKGAAFFTFDKDYRSQRDDEGRKRATNLADGLEKGALAIGKGILGGVTGVLAAPIKGAEEEGAGGFLKGLGKGVAGIITKPVVGIADAGTRVMEGARNTVDKETTQRRRLPRMCPNRHITNFNAKDAAMLEYYVSSYLSRKDPIVNVLVVGHSEAVVLTAGGLTHVVSGQGSSGTLKAQISWKDIGVVSRRPPGVAITYRDRRRDPMIITVDEEKTQTARVVDAIQDCISDARVGDLRKI